MRPTSRAACIVMVCTDAGEADQVSRLVVELNSRYLVTYRGVEELLTKPPVGSVALVILATREAASAIRHALTWLRNRWPRCSVTVIGNVGCGEFERTARAGGANFLTRPVTPEQWRATLTQAVTLAKTEEPNSSLPRVSKLDQD